MQWEKEWNESGSKLSLQWFVMEKAADYAADIELKLWYATLSGVGYANIASAYKKERRPAAPKQFIRHEGYSYQLVEDQETGAQP